MKKMFLIGILMIFVLAFGVSAAGTITVTPNTDTATADVSETVTKTINIQNTNSTNSTTVTLPSTIDLIGTRNNETGVSVSYNVTSPVTIPASGSVDINYTFTVPADAFNETYTGVLTFSDGGDNYDTTTLTLNVNPSPAFTVSSLALDIIKGYAGTGIINLGNTGNTDLTITLTEDDLVDQANSSNTISSSQITIATSPVAVNYQQTESVNVTVDVLSGTPTGTYVGNITGTSNPVVIATLTVNVQDPVPDMDIPAAELDFGNVAQNSTHTETFTITNNGNIPLTNVNIVSSIDAKYNATFNPLSIGNLAVNGTASVDITIHIPIDETASRHSIGTFEVRSDELNETFDVMVDVQGKLIIDDLDVEVDGNKDNVNNGERIGKDAKPESEVTFDIKIKNMFDKNSEIDMDNILVTVTIEEIDDGDDLDEESKEFDLKPDKSERVELNFDIPLAVDEGTYTVIVEVEGEDDNGVDHYIVWELELRVEKKSHEVTIKSAKLDRNTIKCDRTATLTVEAMNIGTNDEEETVLTITNADLDISFSKEFELNEDPDEDDNVYEKKLNINVADDVKAGTYPIIMKLYYDTDNLDDYAALDLTVQDCSTTAPPVEEEPEEEEEEETVVVQPPETVTPEGEVITPTPTVIAGPVKPSFKDTGAYTALITLAYLVAVFVGIVLVYMLINKK